MTKADMKILGRAFSQEIIGGILQTKSLQAKRLADEGYLQYVSFQDGKGWLRMSIEGYQLTHLGRLTYCATYTDADEVLPT